MNTMSALVFDAAVRVRVGGLTLTERAVLLAHRMALRPVRVWGPQALDPASSRRLHARGVSWIQLSAGEPPFTAIGNDEPVLLIGPNVLVEPAALTELAEAARRDDDHFALVTRESGVPLLVVLPPGLATDLRACDSFEAIVASLAAMGLIRERPLTDSFCCRVSTPAHALRAEQAYLRHTNGGARESFFTKIIRRFSVPLSSRLVRIGASPTGVTAGGLVLAVISAWCLSTGDYAAGLVGAALYYVSMIFDCSDGEVARLTLRDSPFGAWLETMVDYATYFLVLGALTIASLGEPGHNGRLAAALVALVGSVVISLVASYLRHRVTPTDPGQFDESSARVLESAGPIHRFARWGRQWIKRSTMAHLIVALAIVDQLHALLYLWAFGATLASFVILAVGPFVVRRVRVSPPAVHN